MKRLFILVSLLLTLSLTASLPAISVSAATQPPTIKKANSCNYTNTISYSGERLDAAGIQAKIGSLGTFKGTQLGMTEKEYKSAMNFKWKDATLYKKKVVKASIDLTKQYKYAQLATIMGNLSTRAGVYRYIIGYSVQRRPIYSLEVDLTGGKAEHTVLLTGQVHARETAGPTYILKQLIDILDAYDKGDERAKDVLSTTRFVAVPCVNPDAHDGIGFNVKKWTYTDGQLWKANANGADLNRNFPGLSWVITKKGYSSTPYNATSSSKIYYAGNHAGSEPETKAMMKFYQYWIGVEKAEMLIDYHQQGRISYTGKSYGTESMNTLSETLRKALYATQKKGPLGRSYNYPEATDEDTYKTFGNNGAGSTNTDYAWAVALGAKFSTSYGFSVFVDRAGIEHPLVEVGHQDNPAYDLEKVKVPTFRSFSWEIGSGRDYLGYSKETLKLIAKEYDNYNFGEMLYTYVDVLRNGE